MRGVTGAVGGWGARWRPEQQETTMYLRSYRVRFRRTALADRRGELVSISLATGDGDDLRLEMAASAAREMCVAITDVLDRGAHGSRRPRSR
jgi:hypothetical protein